MYWYFQHIQAHHNKSWICATIDDKTFFNAQQGLTYIHTHGDVCSVYLSQKMLLSPRLIQNSLSNSKSQVHRFSWWLSLGFLHHTVNLVCSDVSEESTAYTLKSQWNGPGGRQSVRVEEMCGLYTKIYGKFNKTPLYKGEGGTELDLNQQEL